MRILMLSLVLLSSLSAQADTTKTYDADALDLLGTVFQTCPTEFAQAMNGASSVLAATYQASTPNPGGTGATQTYTIVTGSNGSVFKQLTIGMVYQRPGPTDPQGGWTTTCSVIELQHP